MVQILVEILTKFNSEDGKSASCAPQQREVEHIRLHLTDILNILKSTLLDSYAEVKEVSCHCIKLLSFALPKSLSMNGVSSLMEPLAKIISHQQKKIRISSINAIGKHKYH